MQIDEFCTSRFPLFTDRSLSHESPTSSLILVAHVVLIRRCKNFPFFIVIQIKIENLAFLSQ